MACTFGHLPLHAPSAMGRMCMRSTSWAMATMYSAMPPCQAVSCPRQPRSARRRLAMRAPTALRGQLWQAERRMGVSRRPARKSQHIGCEPGVSFFRPPDAGGAATAGRARSAVLWLRTVVAAACPRLPPASGSNVTQSRGDRAADELIAVSEALVFDPVDRNVPPGDPLNGPILARPRYSTTSPSGPIRSVDLVLGKPSRLVETRRVGHDPPKPPIGGPGKVPAPAVAQPPPGNVDRSLLRLDTRSGKATIL